MHVRLLSIQLQLGVNVFLEPKLDFLFNSIEVLARSMLVWVLCVGW